jgi:hypothetical protein
MVGPTRNLDRLANLPCSYDGGKTGTIVSISPPRL